MLGITTSCDLQEYQEAEGGIRAGATASPERVEGLNILSMQRERTAMSGIHVSVSCDSRQQRQTPWLRVTWPERIGRRTQPSVESQSIVNRMSITQKHFERSERELSRQLSETIRARPFR